MKYPEVLINFVLITVCLASSTPRDKFSSEELELKKSILQKGDFNTKIIGGVNATDDQAPWTVLIEVSDNGYISAIFNGAIIAQDSVLTTAATCNWNTKLNYTLTIKYGGTNRLNLTHSTTFTEIIYHPNYTYLMPPYNFCILRLENPVQISSTAQVIPIAKIRPSVGVQANLTGWGSYRTNPDVYPGQLQFGSFSIISNVECQNKGESGITDNFLCAEAIQNNSACWGDHGGPLVVNRELVGLFDRVNFNYYCDPDMPDVFGDTVFIRDWIESIIESEGTGGNSTTGSSTYTTPKSTIGSIGTTPGGITNSTIYTTTSTPGDGESDGNCVNKTIINISIKLNIKIDLSNISNPIINSEISGV